MVAALVGLRVGETVSGEQVPNRTQGSQTDLLVTRVMVTDGVIPIQPPKPSSTWPSGQTACTNKAKLINTIKGATTLDQVRTWTPCSKTHNARSNASMVAVPRGLANANKGQSKKGVSWCAHSVAIST